MRPIPKAVYESADEIEARIRQREFDVMSLSPDSKEHRAIMKEIAQLRVYADAKRWFSSSSPKPRTI